MQQQNYQQLSNNIYTNLKQHNWPTPILNLFEAMENTSNHVLEKDKKTDSINGIRYSISTKPSTLRPIKSWVLRIEQWHYDAIGSIQTHYVLSLRIANTPTMQNTASFIQDIQVHDISIDINDENSWNALMALSSFIAKIDAGRMPDIDAILSLYNFN